MHASRPNVIWSLSASAALLLFILAIVVPTALAADEEAARPNVLLCISDDQTWLHAGAYGDAVVQTPAFDCVAQSGVLFQNAFCVTPSCTPSRGTILTGQHTWRLREGANLHSSLPADIPVLPDLLEAAGYAVGFMGKGWAPGDWKAGGRTRDPAGPRFKSFEAFLKTKKPDQPFYFWFGSKDPHRPYDYESGIAAGKSLKDVTVPAWLPDTPEVRSDILDYYVEIERFDRDLAHFLEVLESKGFLNNTIVIVTSDNGMPFPRSKTTLYDSGTRMPLAVSWPAQVPGGRTLTDFVSFVDFAPTILEAVGLRPLPEMTGRSFLDILLASGKGRLDPARDHVFLARERHVAYRPDGVGYPARGVRTDNFLYIQNLAPERWPAGNPPYFVDVDPSPSKYWMMLNRENPAVGPLFELEFLQRPAEELYDLRKDPWQQHNIADEVEYKEAKEKLAGQLRWELEATGDPRALGLPVTWDSDPYYGREKEDWLKDQQERFEAFKAVLSEKDQE